MKNKPYSSTSAAMEADEILAVHAMLHLIFHRNKNQHGRMKWWKWLSILKRVTGDISACLNPDLSSEHELSAESHKRYLTTLVVPRCYLEFSTVVADGQFSTLGTVLMAALARLVKATGIDRDLKNQAQVAKKRSAFIAPSVKSPKEDAGEPVRRTVDVQSLPVRSEVRTPSEPVSQPEDTKETHGVVDVEVKAPKKKKKKKNAIDDLFAGVL